MSSLVRTALWRRLDEPDLQIDNFGLVARYSELWELAASFDP